MRFVLLSCLSFFWLGSAIAASPSDASLSIVVDSIHHVNCLRATGYLAIHATGGIAPYTYNWSNGDTGTIDGSLAAGQYDITATDNNGNMTTITVAILEDLTLPNANAGADFTAPCSNSLIALMGTGSTGANFQYHWTASNGGLIQSGVNTLTPVIKHTGTFDLQVTNTANGCVSTDEVIVSYTNNPPDVTASGGVFSCGQPLVTLNSTYQQNNTIFVWNGPNGFISYALHPQVGTVGTFVFKVTDTLTACINTANAIVTADTAKPVFPVAGGTINCAMPSIQLSGTATPAGVTFFWKGPFSFTSSLQNPTVSAAGTYSVTVTNPSNGCTTTRSATVTSNFTPPTASAGVSGSITCVSSMVQLFGSGTPAGITYSWIGPGGFTSNISNPFATTPGTYTLTTTNPVNGCTASASTAVMLNTSPPGVTAAGGTRTCANPSVTLQSNSNTPGVTYKWSGPGGFSSTLQNPVVSVTGTYTVTVTNPANGCTSTTSVGVTQNFTPPTVSATTALISCYNPMPHVIATASPAGCSFSWTGPNGFTANVYNPVVTEMGSYTVTATNPANGCTAATSIYVSENLETPSVYAGEDRALNCNFSTILANPIGTSTGNNITYQWTTWDGHIQSGATTLYARFDLPGHYTLTVKNTTSGCTVQDSMEVTQTPPLVANVVQLSGVSCNGGNNGSAQANPDGGAWPYSFHWSNGSTASSITGLTAGTYTVTIMDGEGCSASGSVAVTQPGALVANVSATGQTQQGVNNGTATVTPTGGAAPYTVHWSNGGNTFTISNLAPGQYTVTVTDNNGCTKSNTATVNALNCTITGTTSATNLNCAGSNTGSASATITGAIGQVSYAWSNGGQTQTISNLAAGTYTVTATGANGCTLVLSAQVTSPLPLLLSVDSHTNVSCAGSLNGTATVSATGGTAPYTFHWSNGSNAPSINGLAAGTYTCTVTDSKGCTSTNSTQIASPAAVTLAVGSQTNVPCIDSQNGSITMSAGGGTSPYSFAWSNNAAGATISGLATGTYICTVTDAAGCSQMQSAQIVTTDHTAPQLILKSATVFLGANGTASVTAAQFDNGSFDQDCSITSLTVSPTSFDCSQLGTRTVTLTATDKNGNTATGTTTVTISDNIAPTITCPADLTAAACSPSVTFNLPTVQDNCSQNGTPVLMSGLPSGSAFPPGVTHEQFSYTDGGGNTATCSFNVTVSGALNLEVAASPATCSGSCDGIVQMTVVNGAQPPTSVLWSNGQTGLVITNLCPGAYIATVTDAAGCTQNYSAQVQVSDTQAPIITCPPNVMTGYCTPTTTFLQPQVLDNCPVNLQNLQLTSGLPSGSTFPLGVTTETFRYTDSGGNSAECSFTITIHQASAINVSSTRASCAGVCNGTATITLNGGTGNFGVLWSNGVAGPVASNLCAGFYSATVVDGDGCQQIESVVIAEPQALSLAFSQVLDDIGNNGNGSVVVTISGGTPPYNYLWSLNGVPFTNTKDIFGLHAGAYTLVVTDGNGCVFTPPAFTVNGSVGATEPGQDLNWKVYPNPAQSELYIKLDPEWTGRDANLSIFDASGRLLLEQQLSVRDDTPQRIDLSGLPAGMMMLRLSGEHGIATKIVVKGD